MTELLPARLHFIQNLRIDSYIVISYQALAIRCSRLSLMIGSLERTAQKDSDKALVDIQQKKMLSAAPDQAGKARPIAAAAPHSRAFLHARPCL